MQPLQPLLYGTPTLTLSSTQYCVDVGGVVDVSRSHVGRSAVTAASLAVVSVAVGRGTDH